MTWVAMFRLRHKRRTERDSRYRRPISAAVAMITAFLGVGTALWSVGFVMLARDTVDLLARLAQLSAAWCG
jgi:hypothetical protein